MKDILLLLLAVNIINIFQNWTIMATIKDLNAKVDQLQTALDSEQSQIKDAISKLEQMVSDLEVLVEAGGSEAERQALADKLQGVIDDLSATVIEEVPEESTTSSTTESTTEAPEEEEPENPVI